MPYALIVLVTAILVILLSGDVEAKEDKYLTDYYDLGYKYRVSCEGMMDTYSNEVVIKDPTAPVPMLRVNGPVDYRNKPVSKEMLVPLERCAVFVLNSTKEVR